MSPILTAVRIIPVLLAALLASLTPPVLATDDATEVVVAAAVPSPPATNGYLERTRELVMHALALIGINYKFGGNTPAGGFDCSGLVNHVFPAAELGVNQ